MKIVVAIDSFKGCLTSHEANQAAKEGLEIIFPQAEILTLPVADGGEGILDVLLKVTGGTRISCDVHDPLMKEIKADYGISGDGCTAFIEMAAASGLPLVSTEKRNPMNTTTFGTGEQIADALRRGCRNFIIGLGGSATNDAGIGMLQALGYRFFDENKNEIKDIVCGKHLNIIHQIDSSCVMPQLKESSFTAACDVNNPFYGLQGAAHIFAPQKGADKEIVKHLDEGLRNIAEVIKKTTKVDVSLIPGAGAAGGMGGGLMAFLHATLKPGISLLLDIMHFEEALQNANLVVTGEGKADRQTLMGKVPSGILQMAKRHHIPTLLLAGRVEDCDILKQAGFWETKSITPQTQPLIEAMKPNVAHQNMINALKELFTNSQIDIVQ